MRFSQCQGHLPHPSGEYLPRHALSLGWLPVWSLTLNSLNLPLIAIIGITRRGKEITYTQKGIQRKLERLCSARLTHRDQMVTL
jgi:hypothetical protein